MNLRKSCVMAAGTLFLASTGIIGVTAPAVATPAPTTQTAQPSDPWPSKAYRRGYRDGRKDGWREAKDECDSRSRAYSLRGGGGESDYRRGYEDGWERGYAEGFNEFCY
ncbi:hypothetical protein Aph02nite_76210 [Actinoplanes philippinensis]|uniref:Uncharacterized protein n=1 Tax=Actinoplanes philippinensis TaxID=35752 RepID=A0A1I2HDY5_9ACTN|nr:hypothetical protein [Actinoplanes philippinensis]GIE81671.1 hypothetical protein Aph02nite_76210 [Actinoplanes philippinensis]SFF27583.1 hypothetical protein SAMN05421541_10861 [Actinoplanes philippinensis]